MQGVRRGIGKIEIPEDDVPSHREILAIEPRERARTLRGVGERPDCPLASTCHLAFLEALNARDLVWNRRLEGIEGRFENLEREISSLRDAVLAASRVRSLSPRSGMADVKVGPVSIRGRSSLVGVLIVVLGMIAGAAYAFATHALPCSLAPSHSPPAVAVPAPR